MKKGQAFITTYNPQTLKLENAENYQERLIGEIAEAFLDQTEAQNKKHTLAYSVQNTIVPKEAGEILQAVTIIEPGDINGECYMTKGHFHKDDSCAEIYYCVSGSGKLLLQDKDETLVFDITPGVAAYIPGKYGHRTVNVGEDQFIFMSFWPGSSEYDYDRSLIEPFKKRIFKKDGRIEVK